MLKFSSYDESFDHISDLQAYLERGYLPLLLAISDKLTMSGECSHGSWSHHSPCSAAGDIVAANADEVNRIIIFRVDR